MRARAVLPNWASLPRAGSVDNLAYTMAKPAILDKPAPGRHGGPRLLLWITMLDEAKRDGLSGEQLVVDERNPPARRKTDHAAT